MLSTIVWSDFLAVSGSSYLLILAAEIGDKSQMVCMVLAAKYRAIPVIFGSIVAFVFLNTLAVIFGVTIASWVPEILVLAVVTVLFAIFAIHALRIEEKQDEAYVPLTNSSRIFFTTFSLITLAEFGDKTQLAVIALASTSIPLAVWLATTLALITTSLLGVWAGRTILQRLPITLFHRISGLLFLFLAILAAYKTYTVY